MKKHLNYANEVRNYIEKNCKPRSAWGKGVKGFAFDLLDNYDEYCKYANENGEDMPELNTETLLNGASDWRAYSYGGFALIYDADIAKYLCTPSELKRTRNGEKDPNSRETWMDVQARAIYQANKLILSALNQIRK